jgi:hypothetical protein
MRKINAGEATIAFAGEQYTDLFYIHGSAMISASDDVNYVLMVSIRLVRT